MSNVLFPVEKLPGLAWNIKPTPTFDVLEQVSQNKRSTRIPLIVDPMWKFECAFNYLRDNASENPDQDEFESLLAFFCARGASADSFLIDLSAFTKKPKDATVTGQPLTIDANNNAPIVRTRGGLWDEQIYELQGDGTLYEDGTPLRRQMVPDVATLASWKLDPALFAVIGGGFDVTTCIVCTSHTPRDNRAVSPAIMVTPGETYTFSGYIDTTLLTAPQSAAPRLIVSAPETGEVLGTLTVVTGTDGRHSVSFVVPAGVTRVVITASTNSVAITGTQAMSFSAFQLEPGPAMSDYAVGDYVLYPAEQTETGVLNANNINYGGIVARFLRTIEGPLTADFSWYYRVTFQGGGGGSDTRLGGDSQEFNLFRYGVYEAQQVTFISARE
jgi:hypothetical protein